MTRKRHSVVTGGAGFIGSHLVERLLADGQRVTVIDDFSTGRVENLEGVRSDPNLNVLRGKVSECPELPRLLEEATGIFHLAAAVGVELVVKAPVRTILTNLEETESILEAASAPRVPVLFTSTSEVYGKSSKTAFSEDDDLIIGPPTLGRWSYACSKLMDEFLVMAYWSEKGLPATIARLFNTVGPRQTGQYGMVLPRFIAAAKRNHPLRVFGDGSQTRCFCHVLDTVEALVRLQATAEKGGKVYNVGSTEEISILELARLVIHTLRSKSAIEFVSYNQAYAPGFEDMQRRRPVVDKLLERTGFRPTRQLREIIESAAAVL